MTQRYELSGCPVCGATAASTVADADAIRREIEELWAFHTRRLRGDTPPDRLHDRIAFSQAPPLRIARCTDCDLVYRNPRETPETLEELYRDERPDATALAALFDAQLPAAHRQMRRLARIAPHARHGLEVGSYIGTFLHAARAAGVTFRGIDVNAAANATARAHGLDVTEGTIENVDGEYDVVAIWNCFDQLADPRSAVHAARGLVRNDGWLVLRVPNGAFYAAWRRKLASGRGRLATLLLAHNNLLGFPYRHGFTPRALERLLGFAGFRIERVVGDALVPVADRFTRRWARVEERLVKSVLARLPAAQAPWLEVYARPS